MRRTGRIDTCHRPLRHDALGAKPGTLGEHGKPIFGNMFVKPDASLGFAAGDPPAQPCGPGTGVIRKNESQKLDVDHHKALACDALGQAGNVAELCEMTIANSD
jgi:hypothetical protein